MATAPFSSGGEVNLPIRSSSSPFDSRDKLPQSAEPSHGLFPNLAYSDSEQAEIGRWHGVSEDISTNKHDEIIFRTLNDHLSTRTTLLGSKPSTADILLYNHLSPIVAKWSPEQRTGEHGYHHIIRWIDFVQSSPIYVEGLGSPEKVPIDVEDVRFVPKPLDPKEEKERKKKEKAAAAAAAGGEKPNDTQSAAGQDGKSKKDKAKEQAADLKDNIKAAVGAGDAPPNNRTAKKEKQPKAPKAPAKETPLTPSLIDLRVGHILKAIPHPNADSLYVSTIACGDAAGADNTSEHEGQVVRTVCSGLNGLVPLEEMQDRLVVVVCNLKPVTMRGIKSAAMVLAASPRAVEGQEPDPHKGPVELVSPPSDAKPGERICFEGWEGEPEGVLNPKKKVWESCQVGFTTTPDYEVAFDAAVVTGLAGGEHESDKAKGLGKLKTKAGGTCVVKSLKGATVR
ncbi:MAG: G4 quadruplex nucleic acid binding protein [Sclerophora amabilis]|nr:MAG: G4 quadruplex nucleic acid binding protein [Sclerophora amabilis]